MPNKIFIYYSGATDKTGQALADAMKVKGARTAPKGAQDIVIGWGAKTKEPLKINSKHVFNHPDDIRANRNKFRALELMQAAKVNVAPFADSSVVMAALDDKKNPLALPLVGRTKFHQGGANFITCLTRTHVNNAIDTFANRIGKQSYFQNYIDIVDEYRLHIVNGKLIYAQKKVPRDNMVEAHVEQQSDKIKRLAEKNGKKIDEETLKYALEYQGKKITGPDNIIKSNTRGYKFSNVKLENVNKDLLDQSIAALKALNLQFGAVDCCVDSDKKAWIIEVNTGPGLEGSSFKAYVAAFAEWFDDVLSPPKPAKKDAAKTSEKPAGTTVKAQSVKQSVKDGIDSGKLRMLADMLDNCADDAEKDAVNKVAARLFGGNG